MSQTHLGQHQVHCIVLRYMMWTCLDAVAVVTIAMTVLGYLGSKWWFLDLFSHLRAQCLLVLTALTLTYFLGNRNRWALFTVVFAIVNLAEVAPLYLRLDTTQHGGSKLRVVLANVLGSSQEYQRLREFLIDSGADLVGLIEADETWRRNLRLEEIGLIHYINAIRPNNYSLTLFSKFVLHDARVVILGEGDNPALVARVQIPEGTFTAIVAHLSPPKGRVLASHRDRQFEDLARQIDSIDGALLVMGDLNSTSWSAPFRKFLKPTKLRDSRVGFGVQGTWPTVFSGPAGSLVNTPGVLRIALDHVLTTPEFVVQRRWLGPEVGSDHLPLVVEASLASQSRVDWKGRK